MRVAGISILLALGLLAGQQSWSAPEMALARFSEASAAFDAQDYSRAHALFEQALAEGMDGPAIHYNIGSAALRGGDLPRRTRIPRSCAHAGHGIAGLLQPR